MLSTTGSSDTNIAPKIAPGMLPSPPTTIISNSFSDSSTPKVSGDR